MRNRKIPFFLFLTLGLLLDFALLPKLVSSVLDARMGKNPTYTDMQSVELELSTGSPSLSDLEKLSLLPYAYAVNIQPDQMLMTQAEAEKVITAHLSRLDSLGLCGAFEPSTYSLVPKLMCDLFDPSRNFTVWTASFVSPEVTLLLDVDDETGSILCVSHHRKKSFSMKGVWERNKTVADQLTAFYFSQFDLLETANELCFSDCREVDGGVSEVYYNFSGLVEEPFQIQFNIDGAGGFQIYFHS